MTTSTGALHRACTPAQLYIAPNLKDVEPIILSCGLSWLWFCLSLHLPSASLPTKFDEMRSPTLLSHSWVDRVRHSSNFASIISAVLPVDFDTEVMHAGNFEIYLGLYRYAKKMRFRLKIFVNVRLLLESDMKLLPVRSLWFDFLTG